MVDWNKLVENGNKCGVEYTFYDDIELNKCRCGGTARIYSTRKMGKPYSFENFSITCEKCNSSIHGVYDVSGNPSETFPKKETVMNEKIKEWNKKGGGKTNWKSKIKGFIIYFSFKVKQTVMKNRSKKHGEEQPLNKSIK